MPTWPSTLWPAASGALARAWPRRAPAAVLHGIPQRYVAAGDPYAAQCLTTARRLRERLGLGEDAVSRPSSRARRARAWLQPHTDRTLEALPGGGVRSVQVLCPGFAVDCLETLRKSPWRAGNLFPRRRRALRAYRRPERRAGPGRAITRAGGTNGSRVGGIGPPPRPPMHSCSDEPRLTIPLMSPRELVCARRIWNWRPWPGATRPCRSWPCTAGWTMPLPSPRWHQPAQHFHVVALTGLPRALAPSAGSWYHYVDHGDELFRCRGRAGRGAPPCSGQLARPGLRGQRVCGGCPIPISVERPSC